MPPRPCTRSIGALIAVCALGLVVLGLVASGCSPKRKLLANDAPETTLFVSGPVDPVNHVVHLYWFGSDPDGFVVDYEIRFIYPGDLADTVRWVSTTQIGAGGRPVVRTDSIFTIPAPTGLTDPVFEVRAVDDQGARDATPATEHFTFTNQPPVATFTDRLLARDSTFASATVNWTGGDIDGDPSKLVFLVYMDSLGFQPTNLSGAYRTTARSITIPTAWFRQGGALLSGPRSLFIRAIDDGGRLGAADSMGWYVWAPVTGSDPRLLIVDDAPGAGSLTIDTLYTNTAKRNLPAGTYRVLQLDVNQPFRSTADLEQTLKLFKSVVWYRGTQISVSTLLQNYQDAIASYLDAGGRLYLEGLNLIEGLGVTGSLHNDFVTRYFGSNGLYNSPIAGSVTDSLATWDISSVSGGKPVILRSTLYADSLKQSQIYGGLRGFVIRDTNNVALWARAGSLSQPQNFDMPIGVSVPQPAGGRAIVISLPLRGANLFFSVPRYLAKVFTQLGITGP